MNNKNKIVIIGNGFDLAHGVKKSEIIYLKLMMKNEKKYAIKI